ncbi:uncharacterized protein PFL1_03451 [Pseudozyma flocculosa PF-1]|uniref:Uncharacterized protein n=2 Tax=Pseudozyma flocculosa TaxID=84751 RepID=A0A061H9N5_9BASI|nr:uncharacterized protein PFL1_03451 [Pseudozyma flocculosa PF-1]EPQ29164.1 hypothetical protein PFL1_03451 [Pseudozyma flocculosa PF-1]SPO41539.1 probable YOR1 - ABC transporter [Pseudozyma flocculosa]
MTQSTTPVAIGETARSAGSTSQTSSVDLGLDAHTAAAARGTVASDASQDDEKRRRWTTASSEHSPSLEKPARADDSTTPASKDEADGYEYNPGVRAFEGKHRERWWQVWRPKDLPPPPPANFDAARPSPLATANILSQLYFQWLTPLMVLGYQRPLEATDLYKLPDDCGSEKLSVTLQRDWERRVREAKEYNEKLECGEIRPGWKRKATWTLQSALKPGSGSVKEREAAWRAPPPPPAPTSGAAAPAQKASPQKPRSGHKRPSLVMAMHDQMGRKLWTGLAFKIVGDASQITSPLVLKAIIQFTQERYAAAATDTDGPGVGRGIGLAFALFFMQLLASVCQHQFFWKSMSVGVESRAALIAAIFNRAMRMNGKARSSGKLVNHISTDCSRIDFASAWFTIIFAAPIQIVVCLIILLTQIGPSALAGFAIFVLAAPLQTYTMKCLFMIRRRSMKWTDQRAKSIQEVLGGMRIVKSFSHESRFLQKIREIRNSELRDIRSILIIRAANNAVAFSLPVLAAVVAFVVYSASGHDLNAAKVFPALTLFQLLRMPLMFLPLCLSSTTDAMNAFERLYSVFTAEQLDDAFEYDDKGDDALVIRDASFRWETVEADAAPPTKGGPGGPGAGGAGAARRAKAGGAKGALKDRAKKVFRKAAPAATPAPGLPAPVTASSAVSPTSGQQGQAEVPLYKQVEAEQAAGVAGDNGEATLSEAKIEPKAGDDAGFVHPDDGVARTSGEGGVAPRDGQVSGIGAATALYRAASGGAPAEEAAVNATPAEEVQEPFSMHHLNLRIAKGELVAIVGPVGSGKSSLLQACIGEMRKTSGTVQWGSERVAYCSQSAWIQNATVRDNILFGQSFDEERYWEAVKVSELEADLAILPAGDMTEIGEKGVNLSGGQKQRVNIARALYYDAEIVCLDDPLSAVDAHVGKALFKNAILGLRAKGRTVLLVTHALHFLPEVDRIITLEDGRIAEMGSYQQLSTAHGPFHRLIEEFGGEQEKDDEEKKADEGEAVEGTAEDIQDAKVKKRSGLSKGKNDKSGTLMEAEERNTGSISGHVYYSYLKFGNGVVMVPICVLSLVAMQATNILNSYWLVWWQADQFHQSQGFYMGIFAALGVLMTIFTFIVGMAMGYLSFYACRRLHGEAISRVMFAPMAWLDVTPIGRIMNRFSKDVDVVDNQLADAIRMAANTMASVVGAVILITILTHYFIIAVAVVLVFYFFGALFYRSSAREVKRLDALLRSSLYSHFSETLSGLATIRAYRETNTFIRENIKRMDIENRAYLTSAANQRWLGVRLDLLGALLVLIVAILTTASSNPLTGGNSGVALTYMMTVSQAFAWMTRQVAEVENDTASVERLLHYAESLDQEAAQVREDNPVRDSWPETGSIAFNNVWLSYRPGLPSVLKGISFKVGDGEKVGIVGRTGAGKSSLLTALLRLVELSEGSIVIDGVDVSQIGLQDLRRRLAILPQEPLLFSGTLRSNLDPFNQYDDARLNDALKRAYLVSDDTTGQQTPAALPIGEASDDGSGSAVATTTPASGADTPKARTSRINLDTIIEEEGGNLSVGQRSLVSLARALVKNSQIILLDEATASVDLETDAKIQTTIREEFANRTILCIAHRLRTILAYDRIAVFDQGQLAEYDSPLALFDRPDGIFRGMCERSSITRDEIVRNRAKA